MIDYLSGQVHSVTQDNITLLIQGMGLSIFCPNTITYEPGQSVSLYCHMHWNQENGPTLYGFATSLERSVFLLIIQVPKIGPKIALAALQSLSANQILEAINTQNEKALSAVSGIGGKKAEMIVMQLRSKVAKMITNGMFDASAKEGSFAVWQHLTSALESLGYTKPEISSAIKHLGQSSENKEIIFDKLLRSALAYLSKTP